MIATLLTAFALCLWPGIPLYLVITGMIKEDEANRRELLKHPPPKK